MQRHLAKGKAKAKAKAQQTACLNNLKQIGLATQMFVDDNELARKRTPGINIGSKRFNTFIESKNL